MENEISTFILLCAYPWNDLFFYTVTKWLFANKFYFIFRFICQSRLVPASEMAIIDMRDFLCLLGEHINPIDVQNLKYVLQNSFTGKFPGTLSVLTF